MEWKNEPNKRALAILRVSSAKQKDGLSHDVQEAEVREYCQKHNLKLVEVRRLTESAKNSGQRRQYNASLDWALQNGCLHILWYMHDREARNLQDVEANEKLVVRAGKIILHYVRDGRVLHRESPDGDFFLRDILAASNKQFVRTLSAKVIDAMRKKAQDGWLPCNHVPLGYMHEKLRDEFGRERKRGTTIVSDVNIQNVRLVRREFELRAEGYSYQAIRETTLKEGLVHELRRKSYSRTGIEKRLKNQFYWGVIEWAGETYKGKHPLIIPQEILNKVKATFLTKGYNPRLQSTSFPSGWLKCADEACGCYITYDPKTKPPLKGSTQRRVFEYFRCANGKRVHKTMKGMHFKEFPRRPAGAASHLSYG